MKNLNILVTGGAGFIGSAVARMIIEQTDDRVICLDNLQFASNWLNIEGLETNHRFFFENADIRDGQAVRRIFRDHQPDAVMHLAACSHVDRSIDHPAEFIDNNIVGTFKLLDVTLEYFQELEGIRRERFLFHHVSSDEVFGTLGVEDRPFSDMSLYNPRSPYAASKAASDHLVRSWHHTYGLPIVLSTASNNYGPYQFPEKFIPLVIIRGLKGLPIPIYGNGEHVRDWIHVDDHAEALLLILNRGEPGKTYLVGSRSERRNLDVAKTICSILDQLVPLNSNTSIVSHADLIHFVSDRPGHDFRYALDVTVIERELGWSPKIKFGDGLKNTVDWYFANNLWWEPIIDHEYDLGRLGAFGTESTIT